MHKRSIGLLGGTFDPIHIGHITLAENALHKLDLDEIWIIPASLPNFKQGEVSSSIEDRLAMCELATSNSRNIKVCDIEAKRDGVTYSVDTVSEIMKSKDPDEEFVFLLGNDAASKLPKWRGAQTLASLIPFRIFKREGFDCDIDATGEELRDFGFDIEFFNADIPPISSTDLRVSLKSKSPNPDLFPSGVLQYIQSHNLYE